MSAIECRRRPGTVWSTCPCDPCARSRRRMAKLARTGRYQRVPPEAAWDVVEMWIDRGWTGHAMASAVGTSRRTIEGALTIYRATGRRQSFGPTLARQIVQRADARPTQGQVGVLGTRRRLQALTVMRWSLAALSQRTGLPDTTLSVLREGHTTRVAAKTANLIADVYDALADVDGGHAAAGERARRRGWLPPVAWDDPDDPAETGGRPSDDGEEDDVVDEVAVERAVLGRPAFPVRLVDRREAVRRLTDEGWSLKRMAALFHVDPQTILRDRKAVASTAEAA